MARREADLAKREAALAASRAKALDDCKPGSVQTITRVEVPARAAGYSRRDVEPMVRERVALADFFACCVAVCDEVNGAAAAKVVP